jgi:hypothetical protein
MPIVDKIKGNVLETDCLHICFAINIQGDNSRGFSGIIAREYWPDIEKTKKMMLGETIGWKCGSITFHGLVCYSLDQVHGWDETPDAVTKCLNSLSIPDDEVIAIVRIGEGGGREEDIEGGIARSNKNVVIYRNYFNF